MMTARSACHNVSPGDMIACLGSGTIADLIRTVSPSHTHVAIIASGRPAVVAESTATSSLPDMESGLLTIGVQSHFFSDFLAAYDGQVWLYQLRDVLPYDKEETLAGWIESEHRGNVGYNFAGVMRLGLERIRQMASANMGALFCSEMVATAYKAIGLLPATVVPGEVTPDDACVWPLFRFPIQLK